MFHLTSIILTFGNIEAEIKSLEKSFSKKDFKDFEEKFKKDLSSKQYDLESAKVYETASNQINLKRQKFNSVSQKMINEYGKKYKEIMAKDITEEEKISLAHNLLEETKSYDEKNRHAILRLNSEYENLAQNFQGKVQDAKTIYSQMQNLHLFDKNRYFEDMKASIEPKLRDLYKKRYLLNNYRIEHNEIVHNGKQNIFSDFANNLFSKLKSKNSMLMIGPHFERELPNKNLQSDVNVEDIDKNLIKALAEFFSKDVLDNKLEFEDYLIVYFKEHYRDIINSNSTFLYDFSNSSENYEGDLFKIARYFEIEPSCLQNSIGINLTVIDGLIYSYNNDGLNIIYATDKAVTGLIEDLYGMSLYHRHLAIENNLIANNVLSLQTAFIKYTNQNEITIDNSFNSNKLKRRFIKKKVTLDNQNNIVDFKSKSC